MVKRARTDKLAPPLLLTTAHHDKIMQTTNENAKLNKQQKQSLLATTVPQRSKEISSETQLQQDKHGHLTTRTSFTGELPMLRSRQQEKHDDLVNKRCSVHHEMFVCADNSNNKDSNMTQSM